ncbi:MAG TPA: PLP-dependent aminotransferase family protein [Caulobacteraceae bacterium]|jgi:DNA-binding transcriptional MocR family regulator
MNMPPQFDDQKLARRLWEAFTEVERREGLSLLMRYQEPGGAQKDRVVGAGWLGSRIPNLTPERTMISAGAQAAIVAVLGVLANRGDVICTEAMAYPGLRTAAARLGLEVLRLELDDEGILPTALAKACREVGVKALCCTPTLQNPTTATMSLARREEIIAVARRHRLAILEDDAYGRLPDPALPALAALAPDLTWHIAGLAKLVSPALRIAYVAAPDAQGAVQVAAQLRAISGMASPITAAAATHRISTGLASAALAAIRSETRARRRIAAEALGNVAAEPADAFHPWLRLPSPWSRGTFLAALRSHEISVVPSDAFATSGDPPEAVRIGLGAPRTRDDLARALSTIAQVLTPPQPSRSYV